LPREWAKNASKACHRNIHFSVSDDKPPPFPTHWRYKGSWGVSFPRRETATAEAWIVTALLAGYIVFAHWRKRSGGFGRGLEDDDYPEDNALRLGG